MTADRDDETPPTFVCNDCGYAVFRAVELSANDNETRCLACAFIATQPAHIRSQLRQAFNRKD